MTLYPIVVVSISNQMYFSGDFGKNLSPFFLNEKNVKRGLHYFYVYLSNSRTPFLGEHF